LAEGGKILFSAQDAAASVLDQFSKTLPPRSVVRV
jgi:hypothetical protein